MAFQKLHHCRPDFGTQESPPSRAELEGRYPLAFHPLGKSYNAKWKDFEFSGAFDLSTYESYLRYAWSQRTNQQYHSEAWVNLNDITFIIIALGLEKLAPAAVKEKLYGDDKLLKTG